MMRVAGYEFADGARFQAGAIDNAAAVGAHLDHLREHFKGELTPKDVIDDARNPNSPLHSFFEWDDGAAAEQHRLHQARGLIRSVVAIYVSPKEPARRTKAFVHIGRRGGRADAVGAAGRQPVLDHAEANLVTLATSVSGATTSGATLLGGSVVFTLAAPQADMARFVGEFVYDVRLERDGLPDQVVFGGALVFVQGVTRGVLAA